jgi:hypothetical protein
MCRKARLWCPTDLAHFFLSTTWTYIKDAPWSRHKKGTVIQFNLVGPLYHWQEKAVKNILL